jgi:hypothetical protein
MKEDSERTWTRCPDCHPIPRGIMLPSYTLPNRIVLQDEPATDMADNDDALLVAASIGPESQSTSCPLSQP